MVSQKDQQTIRGLATRWRELASLAVMKERIIRKKGIGGARGRRLTAGLFPGQEVNGIQAEAEVR